MSFPLWKLSNSLNLNKCRLVFSEFFMLMFLICFVASTWEIRDLNTSMGSHTPRCVVTQMLEIHSAGWFRWRKNHCSKFEKSVPYALLCQVAGEELIIYFSMLFFHFCNLQPNQLTNSQIKTISTHKTTLLLKTIYKFTINLVSVIQFYVKSLANQATNSPREKQ